MADPRSVTPRREGLSTQVGGLEANPNLVTTAEAFYGRLNASDVVAVRGVVEVVDSLAAQYNQDGFLGENGYFAVYAIGGNVTKPGKRPDIDLLVVEGAYFPESYFNNHETEGTTDFERWQRVDRRRSEGYNGDWVASELQEWFERHGYQASLVEGMPDGYEEGISPKGLLRLAPASEDSERSPIDVIIAKVASEMGMGDPRTLADFEAIDVDAAGNPLPKILLRKRENLGRVPELHW
jgi:hypothetical protein